MTTRHRALLLVDAIALLAYLATVVLGGVMRPGYSHVTQAVSELIKAGAEDIRSVLAASTSEARGCS